MLQRTAPLDCVLVPAFLMSAYALSVVNTGPASVSRNLPQTRPNFTGLWSGEDTVFNANGLIRVRKSVSLRMLDHYGLEGNISWESEEVVATGDAEIALVEVSDDNKILQGRE